MATRTISVLGGNWSALATWVEGAVPVAGDSVVALAGGLSGPLTVDVASACATFVMTNYTNTLTFTSTLTTTSTVTFAPGMTVAGTAGQLTLTGSPTITSAGKTLTCALLLNGGIFTLADNWVVHGLVSVGVTTGAMSIAGAGRTLTCNGGFRNAGTTNTLSGAAKLIITGGTWDAVSSGLVSCPVDLAGNVTVSGTVLYGTGPLTYVSGAIATAGSTLVASGATTFNTAGVTWNHLTAVGNGLTHTLSSDLSHSGTITLGNTTQTWAGAGTLVGPGNVTVQTGTLTLNNTDGIATAGTMTLPNGNVTFAGTAGWTVGTLTNTAYTASRTVTLTQTNTYTVTGTIANVGTTSAVRQSIVSSHATLRAALTLQAGGTSDLIYCDPARVDSSAGEPIFSIRGTLTDALNWYNSVSVPGGLSLINPYEACGYMIKT